MLWFAAFVSAKYNESKKPKINLIDNELEYMGSNNLGQVVCLDDVLLPHLYFWKWPAIGLGITV